MHASALTELVGREEELELLLRRWSRAKTGEGQVVLLSGEPGIGKSRLTAALMDRLAGDRGEPCDVVAATGTDVCDGYTGFDAKQTYELGRFIGGVALLDR